MTDPYAVLGLEPALDIDPADLERRYLQLSRACHPDHHDGGDAVAVLTRSAEVNDAYRVLRDRWRRAEALLELRSPGELERRKQLGPGFLMGALELAERVAQAEPGSAAAAALRAQLDSRIADDWQRVATAIAREDWPSAATQLQQSRYHRKARRDLDD